MAARKRKKATKAKKHCKKGVTRAGKCRKVKCKRGLTKRGTCRKSGKRKAH